MLVQEKTSSLYILILRRQSEHRTNLAFRTRMIRLSSLKGLQEAVVSSVAQQSEIQVPRAFESVASNAVTGKARRLKT